MSDQDYKLVYAKVADISNKIFAQSGKVTMVNLLKETGDLANKAIITKCLKEWRSKQNSSADNINDIFAAVSAPQSSGEDKTVIVNVQAVSTNTNTPTNTNTKTNANSEGAKQSDMRNKPQVHNSNPNQNAKKAKHHSQNQNQTNTRNKPSFKKLDPKDRAIAELLKSLSSQDKAALLQRSIDKEIWQEMQKIENLQDISIEDLQIIVIKLEQFLNKEQLA
ncbi:MAG: hypothetical protein COB50_04025 [Thiotrichales bacterium]|nr:MAG: hypothetical protein COB50_04025 [Thiotrichales bacterium]